MKFSKSSIVIASLLVSTSAFAQSKKASAGKSYRLPPYGMAGCGLGATILGDKNEMGPQLLAATTNNYFFPASSAITSGTSNCTDTPAGSEEAYRMERETFVSMNLGDLNKEAAQGEGNHLRGLAEMIGCGSEEQVEIFAAVAQSEHSDIFSDAVPAKVTQRFLDRAQTSEVLQECVRGR